MDILKDLEENRKLYIIDAHSMIYRAYYVFIRRPLINSKGFNTSAIYGFLRMLFRLIKNFNPLYLVTSYDTGKPSFRNEIFVDYKKSRKKMPDDLIAQLPIIKKVINLFGIYSLEIEGFESDDVIASLAKKFSEKNFEVYIISKDKDLAQLVNDKIFLIQPVETKKGTTDFEILDRNAVLEKYKVEPEYIVDFLALTGDNVDDIPGVKGVGPVAAAELLKEFKTIENIYNNIDKISSNSLKEKLLKDKDNAFLSKELVKLNCDIDLNLSEDDLKIRPPKKEEILKIFDELEIKTLLKDVEWFDRFSKSGGKEYILVNEIDLFENLLNEISNSEIIAVDTETDSIDPNSASLVGISIAVKKNKAYYIPVGHLSLLATKQLDKSYVIEKLKPYLESENLKIVGQNIKYDYIILKREGIELNNIYFDTMVGSYLLNPTKTRHNLNELALHFLGYKMISYNEVVGKGKTFREVPPERAYEYSAEDADISLQLFDIIYKKLKESGLLELYYEIDIPLIKVLADMEMTGVKIDTKIIKEIDKEITTRLNELTSIIYKEAGEVFNINSPQQLSRILFDKLKLPVVKKGKIGESTDVDVLFQLKKFHPIAEFLIEYRSLNKLKTTYIDILPGMINPKTGRVHTTFSQTTTATGRLASSNPNLQNIPIRDYYGKKLREAFIAENGNLILSADYSQIELRILAHLADDEVLIESFKRNEDIHNRTVKEIYNIDKKDITPELRRIAKVINYGVAYGISAYGLAQDLEIDVSEANNIIKKYFERYKGIANYIERMKKFIEENNYVENLFKRKRYMPDIKSASKEQKAFIIRTAINTPVQGTAADLIKVAMIRIFNEFKKRNLKSKMILQVHDELVFEVFPKELEEVKEIVKDKMENAIKLKVPLVVDIKYGKNWAEAH